MPPLPRRAITSYASTLSDRSGPLVQGEESRRQARCGARRRSAKPESAPSDWHPSAGAALGAPPWFSNFLPCDPRTSVYHRRISAPRTCRPHASGVAARANGYERGARSRRVERRRPPRLLVLQKTADRQGSDNVVPGRTESNVGTTSVPLIGCSGLGGGPRQPLDSHLACTCHTVVLLKYESCGLNSR